MPNIKSAIKRVNISNKKTLANKSKRSEIRSELKKTKAALAESADNAGQMVRETQARLDKAAAKGYLHKNNVARKKAKLARSLNQAKS